MKRLILLSALLIFACSSDDSTSDDSNDGDVILCTKRTQQYETNNGEQITKTYEYNYAGTQLLSWIYTASGFTSNTNLNRTKTYSNLYEDNLVTSMMLTTDNSNNGNINSSVVYEFEYDNLGRKTKQTVNGSDQYFYNYLNNGLTVQITDSDGQLNSIHTYDSNKNRVETEGFDSNGLSNGSTIYTHDDKNMPFKNVTSFHPLSSYLYISTNNTISSQSNDCISTDDITYNDNDYPINIVNTYSCSNTIRTYTLEYNN
ncbi:hypothetical protein N9Q89_06700 [Flavobacteriaceae bacterium]|nr:hypothetical protein [Flavobacteriaceae bacterium]